mmetsp:Transcript_36359/g.96674  ORF Transcript_36359/g.96674 Transcript_36359/m.96674 type:complete len:168 (-) Transcript_36359:81-584(-)
MVLQASGAEECRVLSWCEKAAKRDRIVAALLESLPADIKTGAIYSKSSLEWSLCREVCSALRISFSPINSCLAKEQVYQIINESAPDIVFFSKERLSCISMLKTSSSVKVWVCMDGEVKGALSLAELIARGREPEPPRKLRPRSNHVAQVLSRLKQWVPHPRPAAMH